MSNVFKISNFAVDDTQLVTAKYDTPVKMLYLIPGFVVFLLLLPQSYGAIFVPNIPRILNMVKSVTVLWIGLLTLRKDRESFLLLSVLAVCIGFSLIASNIDRVLSPLGIFLAPRLLSIINPLPNTDTLASEELE